MVFRFSSWRLGGNTDRQSEKHLGRKAFAQFTWVTTTQHRSRWSGHGGPAPAAVPRPRSPASAPWVGRPAVKPEKEIRPQCLGQFSHLLLYRGDSVRVNQSFTWGCPEMKISRRTLISLASDACATARERFALTTSDFRISWKRVFKMLNLCFRKLQYLKLQVD